MFVGRTNANVFARPLDAPTGIVQLDARDTWKKVYLGFKPDVVIVSNVLKRSGYRMHSFYIKDYEDEVKNYYADGYRYNLIYRWWYEYPNYNCLRIEDDGFSVKITQGWNYTESEENQLYYFASSKNKPELLTLEHNKGRVKSYDEPVRVELGTRPEMLQIVAKNDTRVQLLDTRSLGESYTSDEVYDKCGLRLEVLEDGGIRYYGTQENDYYESIAYEYVYLEPGTYTLSGIENAEHVLCFSVQINNIHYYDKTFTISIAGEYAISIRTYTNGYLDNVVVYPMLNKGSEALPYEPFVDEEESSTFRNYYYLDAKYEGSSQLINIDDAIDGFSSDWLYNTYGFRREVLEDGGIRYYGTQTDDGYNQCGYVTVNLEPGTYTLNGGNEYVGVYINYGTTNKAPYTFTLSSAKTCTVYFQTSGKKTFDTVIYPMLNKGNKALPFEQYKAFSSYDTWNATAVNKTSEYGTNMSSVSSKTSDDALLVEIDDTGFTLNPGLGEYVYYVRPLPGETVM